MVVSTPQLGMVVSAMQRGMVVSTPLDHHRKSQLKNKTRWSSGARWSSGVETIREFRSAAHEKDQIKAILLVRF
ncbi:MAG: hypothetical protein AB9834_11880 [Lentimicrobium sp.]